MIRPRPRRGPRQLAGRRSPRTECGRQVLDGAADAPDRTTVAQLWNNQSVEEELAVDGFGVLRARTCEHQPHGDGNRQQLIVYGFTSQPTEQRAPIGISETLHTCDVLRYCS